MAIPVISATAVGAKNVIGFLADIKKQERFATAQALTDSAWQAQKWTVKELLPKKFTLRAKNRPWQEFGKYRFKVTRATKQKLSAEVESSAPWIIDHERGGTRHGINGLGQPIPVTARPAPKSVIPTKWMVKKLAKRKGAILMPGRRGQGLYVQQPNGGLRLFHWLLPSARIPATLGFEKDAPKQAVKHFPGAFKTRFKAALRDSARRNGLKP